MAYVMYPLFHSGDNFDIIMQNYLAKAVYDEIIIWVLTEYVRSWTYSSENVKGYFMVYQGSLHMTLIW